MEVGQVTETVEVQADAALVETRNTGISQMIDNTRVLELPLNGRQVTELVLLSGVATTSTQGTLNPGSRNYPTIIIQVAGGMQAGLRSEERRVGKECRSRLSAERQKDR